MENESLHETSGAVGKPIAIALSFANLCYLRVWSELLSYTPAQTYEMRSPPAPQHYLAVSLNVLIWGAGFGLAAVTLQRARPALRRAGQWLFLVALVVPLHALREVLASRLPVGQQYLRGGLYAALGPAGLAVLAAAATGCAWFVLFRRREQAVRMARTLLLALIPLVALTLLEAGWRAAHCDPRPFRDAALAARLDATPPAARRAVWVIFDEWDQRLTFDDRPADLGLPEIDRLAAESLQALDARPPAANTLESMPALITGRLIAAAEPRGTAELRLTFRAAGTAVDWRRVRNVFDDARALGLDTALAGVYHPYCRVLAASLSWCWWSDIPRPSNSHGATLAEAMYGQTRSLFETWRLSLFGPSLSTVRKGREFPAALERAATAAADPSYGLVLVHLLTPHFPHAYDRRSGTFTLGNAPLRGYYDSLALTDRALGRLRQAMENSGVWATTTVLVSSDHPLKHAQLLDGKSDPRVPFLLKLAGETAALTYAARFNTVATRALLGEVLRGRVSTARQAAAWLDQRREGSGWPSD
jgi:hypothetical protein